MASGGLSNRAIILGVALAVGVLAFLLVDPPGTGSYAAGYKTGQAIGLGLMAGVITWAALKFLRRRG